MYTFEGLGAVDVSTIASSLIGNGGTFGDYVNAVAKSDAGVERGVNTAETLSRILAKGWIPIYCSNASGGISGGIGRATGMSSSSGGGKELRDRIAIHLRNAGWEGKNWQSGNYYGWTVNVNTAPNAVVTASKQFCSNEAISTALKLIYDAKHMWGEPTGDPDPAAACKARAAQLVALTKCAPKPLAAPRERLPIRPLTFNTPTQQGNSSGNNTNSPPSTGTDIVPASDAPVDKPFYKKWWFYVSLATVGVLGTTAIIILRRRAKRA